MYELIIPLHTACCSQTPSYQGHGRSSAKPGTDLSDWQSMPGPSAPAQSKLGHYSPSVVVASRSRSHSSLLICFLLFPKENEKQDLNDLLLQTSLRCWTLGRSAPWQDSPGHWSPLATFVLLSAEPHSLSSAPAAVEHSPILCGIRNIFHLPHLVPKPPPSVSCPWLIIFVDKNLTFHALGDLQALLPSLSPPEALGYWPLLTS